MEYVYSPRTLPRVLGTSSGPVMGSEDALLMTQCHYTNLKLLKKRGDVMARVSISHKGKRTSLCICRHYKVKTINLPRLKGVEKRALNRASGVCKTAVLKPEGFSHYGPLGLREKLGRYGLVLLKKDKKEGFWDEFILTGLTSPESEVSEDKAKDTSEVADATAKEDGEVHGGDNNSQEVANSTAEKESPDSKNEDPSDGGGVAVGVAKMLAEANRKGGDNRNGGRGWVVVPTGDTFFHPTKGIPQLERAIVRFFEASKKGGEMGSRSHSPRVNPSKLVVELTSRRMALSRCNRQELAGLPKLLLTTDSSGSCSTASRGTGQLCTHLGETLPGAIVVDHANGDIYTVTRDGVTVRYGSPEFSEEFGEMSSREQWAYLADGCVGSLMFGDSDGLEKYSSVWEEAGVMTVHMASDYAVARGTVAECDLVSNWHVPGKSDRLVAYDGVNEPAAAAAAIRRSIRK